MGQQDNEVYVSIYAKHKSFHKNRGNDMCFKAAKLHMWSLRKPFCLRNNSVDIYIFNMQAGAIYDHAMTKPICNVILQLF